ncbi:MAG: IPExxxVDY family protein [Bacteroidales bacterium]
MKNKPKITRVQLQVSGEESYVLLGIASTEPDYKLSLLLNRILNLSLRNVNPVEIAFEDGRHLSFSRFTSHSEELESTCSLIANRTGNDFLIRKLNKIDYFLLIHSPEAETEAERITPDLRNIDCITAVFNLNPADIRDKNLQYLIP